MIGKTEDAAMENRIPPPIIGLFSIFLVWATASLLPGLGQNLPLANALAAALAVIGLAIAGAGVVGFRKAQTTVMRCFSSFQDWCQRSS